jgi:AcrR family transcriptional regulator
VASLQNSSPGRPFASTPDAVEEVALRLMLESGYDAVSVDDIAAAAGVSRSTFFRYCGSKTAIVWRDFDRALDMLSAALGEQSAEIGTLAAVRAAIAKSVRAAIDDRGAWWERFVLLDQVPALRGEAADRWDRWIGTVAAFVAGRMEVHPSHPVPVALAHAFQGIYLTTVRTWEGRPGDPENMLARMLLALETVGAELEGLLQLRDVAGFAFD